MAGSMYVIQRIPATIAAGASLSGAVDLLGGIFVAVEMPAAWTAAAMTFLAASTFTGTYKDVYVDRGATELNLTVAASRYVHLAAGDAVGMNFVQVRSGTSAAAVVQVVEAIPILIVKMFAPI